MRRGAGVVDRGGLENRCTFTGTVGSNPTLSASRFQAKDGQHLPLSAFVLLERSPNWYGTALEARRVERPVRVRVPLSPLACKKLRAEW
jgi:hypothetical protein